MSLRQIFSQNLLPFFEYSCVFSNSLLNENCCPFYQVMSPYTLSVSVCLACLVVLVCLISLISLVSLVCLVRLVRLASIVSLICLASSIVSVCLLSTDQRLMSPATRSSENPLYHTLHDPESLLRQRHSQQQNQSQSHIRSQSYPPTPTVGKDHTFGRDPEAPTGKSTSTSSSLEQEFQDLARQSEAEERGNMHGEYNSRPSTAGEDEGGGVLTIS